MSDTQREKAAWLAFEQATEHFKACLRQIMLSPSADNEGTITSKGQHLLDLVAMIYEQAAADAHFYQ